MNLKLQHSPTPRPHRLESNTFMPVHLSNYVQRRFHNKEMEEDETTVQLGFRQIQKKWCRPKEKMVIFRRNGGHLWASRQYYTDDSAGFLKG